MTSAIDLGGDVVAAGSALAGFILVYLGAVATGYASFDAQQQKSVRAAFARRAWFAFVGIVFCLASVSFALIGKWWNIVCWADGAIVTLFIAVIWSAITALLAVLEIR